MQNFNAWFDSDWYCQQYPDIAEAGVDPYRHYINHGIKEGRLPCPLQALEWDVALWQQFNSPTECLDALHISLDKSQPLEASYAAFALGRWYGWKAQWAEAARVLASRPSEGPCLPNHFGADLLEIEACTRAGYFSAAWYKLRQLRTRAPEFLDAHLAVSNLLGAFGQAFKLAQLPAKNTLPLQRLGWINRVWREVGIDPVMRQDAQQALTMDNLKPVNQYPVLEFTEHEKNQRAPLVSVIVPVFNAGVALLTALKSLAAQTLAARFPGAVEVIVVDDASTDDTAEVAKAFAAQNQGFRVLRQQQNAGAYAARNRGLSEARGECITVHDSDDWSHPQKLEIQWQGLQDNSQWLACNSHWVRCTADLMFTHWRMEQGWVYRNTSSLMFRRRVFDTLGYWDRVRVEADTEYYYRIQAAFGSQCLGEVLPGVPLAFGRVVPTSLSVASKTHLVTQFTGVRADYRKASVAWHAEATKTSDLYLPERPLARPFWAPAEILA